MKKILLQTVVLLLSLVTFTSCMNDDKGSNLYIDQVAIVTSGDSCYFIGSGGAKYVPNVAFTNTKNMKVAFIQFSILKDMTTGSQKQYVIQITSGPVGLDATLNSAPTAAQLDSTKNDSIIGTAVSSFIGNRHLVLAVNYFIGSKTHYSTLTYAADKGFVRSADANTPDTLKFELRHNAKNDVASLVTSFRKYYDYGYASSYYYAYDIHTPLQTALHLNGNKKIYVDIAYKKLETNEVGKVSVDHIGFVYPLTAK